MQGLIEFVAALVTSLAVAVFSQFGVDLRADDDSAQPEIRRTMEREAESPSSDFRAGPASDC